MNLKSLLTSVAVVVLIGTTASSATEFWFDENKSGGVVLSSNDETRSHYGGTFQRELGKEGEPKELVDRVPMIHYYKPGQAPKIIHSTVSSILPQECAKRLTASICGEPLNDLKIFFVAQPLPETADPRFMTAYFPDAAIDYPCWNGDAKIADSDSKKVYFQRVHSIQGRLTAKAQNQVDPIAEPVTISQAHSMQTSHAMDQTPMLVRGLTRGQPDSFWTYYQYKPYSDKTNGIACINWILNADQEKALNQMVIDVGLGVLMSKTQLLKNMEALGKSPAFAGTGHVSKFLSLFGDEFSLATDAKCPFALTGFGDPEGKHRWTVATQASITVPLNSAKYPRPKKIRFVDSQANLSVNTVQELEVLLNGVTCSRHTYKTSDQKIDIEVDIPDDGSTEAKIEFNIPNAASPGASDPRQLGVLFRGFNFTY